MAQIFTSNQVNHAYVAKRFISGNNPLADDALPGDAVVRKVGDDIFLQIKNAAGKIERTDLINKNKVMTLSCTGVNEMSRTKNAAIITLNAEALDSGNVITGEDYILRLAFINPVGMSPDNEYWKQAVVHATANMTDSTFYYKMAKSLSINLSREAVKLLDIYLLSAGAQPSDPQVATLIEDADPSDPFTGIMLVEAEQEWILGVKQDKPIIFKINNSTINTDVDEVYWADVVYTNGIKYTGGSEIEKEVETPLTSFSDFTDELAIPNYNSHKAAELEYFAHGERGDIYRNVGWPDVYNTKYMVDPEFEYGYAMVNVHYYYDGSNHAVQKSEKDMTIICLGDGSADFGSQVANSIYGQIRTYINS